MDVHEYIADIVLVAVLVISTIVLVVRLYYDLTIVVSATLMMLSLGTLLVMIHRKIRLIERNMVSRERMIRVNLEEISTKMSHKYDSTITHIDGVLDEISKRVYR
jgi:hypothetical protein